MKTKKQIKETCKEIAYRLITARNSKSLNEEYIAECWQYIARLALSNYDKTFANALGLESIHNIIKNYTE